MDQAIHDPLARRSSGIGYLLGLERARARLNGLLEWAGGAALLGMLLFTVADVVLRALGRPIAGSYEVIGWLAACAVALVLGPVQQHRGHVAVELFEARFGPRVKAVVALANSLLGLLLFSVVAWYVARYASVLQETGSLSETLRVTVYPWVYVVAAGCFGLAFALLIDLLRAVAHLLAMRQTS